MRNLILYLTFLLSSIISPQLSAQQQHVQNMVWRSAAQIPPAKNQTEAKGLAGAISGADRHTLIIAGGTNFPDEMPWEGGKKKYYSDVFIYLKTTGGLLPITAREELHLPFNLAYSAVCSTTNGIIVAGGENENGLCKKVFCLKWKEGQLLTTFLPDLPMGLSNAALAVIGNELYLAGGETENGATQQFLKLDLNEPHKSWEKLPDLPHPVSHTLLLSAGKEIFLLGGRKRNPGDTSTLYSSVFAFDTGRATWMAKRDLPYALSAASGHAIGNELLVFSGDRGETFHQAEKLIAAIEKEKDPLKKEKLNQQKTLVQSNHPGFSRSVLKYDVEKNTWQQLKNIMPYGTVTTNAVFLDREVIIAGGEIKAGVRTPDILIGKIKWNK